jgi:hypothetical protein
LIEYCQYILCKRKASRDGFCVHHAKYFARPKVKKTGISRVSEKRIAEAKKYKKIVVEILTTRPQCEINSPVCTIKAQGLDHMQKRSPNNYLLQSNLKSACNACNLYKELYPGWAEANGHSISRFKK